MTQNNSDNNGKSSKNKNPCKNQIRKFKKIKKINNNLIQNLENSKSR